MKDFGGWNEKKKTLELLEIKEDFYFHEREVWWTNIGVNIGKEIDGKNENFERPVLIIRKINKYLFLGVPLTSRFKDGEFYPQINYVDVDELATACILQIRVFSSNRLIRRVGTIQETNFLDIKMKFINYFSHKEKPLDDMHQGDSSNDSQVFTQDLGGRGPYL